MKKAAIYILMIITLAQIASAETTREEALKTIQQAELDIKEMQEQGYPTNSVNDTLTEAKKALERADFAELIRQNPSGVIADEAKKALEGMDYQGFTYQEVTRYTEEIKTRKKQATQISDTTKVIERKMKEYKEQKIDVSQAETMFQEAKKAFENERYKETEQLLTQTNTELENKKAELATISIMMTSGKSFMQKNWISMTILLTTIIVSGAITHKGMERKKKKDQLKKLKTEQAILTKLMKKTQEERYKKGGMSKIVYDIRMERYHKRMNEVQQQIPVIESQIKR